MNQFLCVDGSEFELFSIGLTQHQFQSFKYPAKTLPNRGGRNALDMGVLRGEALHGDEEAEAQVFAVKRHFVFDHEGNLR